MRSESGDWEQFRSLPDLVEVVLPTTDEEEGMGRSPRAASHENFAAKINRLTLEALEEAYRDHKRFVMFVHGAATFRQGRATSRSIVRALMRRPSATHYIVRSECIQHEAVFVAAMRRDALPGS